jgi:O-acetylhomoserine/O-acetylserine sulfhydrylase
MEEPLIRYNPSTFLSLELQRLISDQFRVYMKKFNIICKFVEGQDPENIRKAIDENTRAIYCETIGNPQFNVPDLKAISDVAHEAGIPLIVDNTFGMGGFLCKPISLGADIVTESVTKWVGGHGTSMGGIVIDGGHFDWSASGKFPAFTEPADGYHGYISLRLSFDISLTFLLACASGKHTVLKHSQPD